MTQSKVAGMMTRYSYLRRGGNVKGRGRNLYDSVIRTVAIIGAGPYGLSIASHLRSAGISFRIFGQPMEPWQNNMPPDMMLKSGTDASDIVHPEQLFSLAEFYRANDWACRRDLPIPATRFVDYGQEFARRFVPDLDTRRVASITAKPDGSFLLTMADGDEAHAAHVIIAVGVYPFRYIPPVLQGFDADRVTHSSAYGAISDLAGKTVAVIGGGASAIDLAVALHEQGIRTTVLTRRPSIDFHQPPQPWRGLRSHLDQLRCPTSPIGTGWPIKFCASTPGLLHHLPSATKWRMANTYLGAAPGWFMRERALDLPIVTGQEITKAELTSDGICLHHRSADGSVSRFAANHVVAATGYQVDTQRLEILDETIRSGINTINGAPVLSDRFETSHRNLYIVGPAAAASFGPVMRFVYGAGFTARRLRRHLSASIDRPARMVSVAAPVALSGLS